MKKFTYLLVFVLMFSWIPTGIVQASDTPDNGIQIPEDQQPADEEETARPTEPEKPVEEKPAKEDPVEKKPPVTTPVEPPEDGQKEPDNPQQEPKRGDEEDGENEEEAPADYELKMEYEQKNDILYVKASISGMKERYAKGSWTFEVDGVKKSRKGWSPQQQESFQLKRNYPGSAHLIDITFNGKIKGQSVHLSTADTFVVPEEPGTNNLDIGHGFVHQGVLLKADLPNSENASGRWTFKLNGKEKVLKDTKGTSQEAVIGANVKPGQRYVATVEFLGKSDGEKIRVETDYVLKAVNIDVKTTCSEKGLQVNTEVVGTEEASGNWVIDLVGSTEERHQSGKVDGDQYSTTFPKKDLEPGSYDILVDYKGSAEGGTVNLYDVDHIRLDKDSPCITVPDNGERPDDGKDTDPGKEKDRETSDEIKNGANMPDTSTNYPWGVLIGSGIALLGVVLYVLRKTFMKS
ncbi:hypothetical protein [Paludifilum halophilum]|uniref:Uncharacterized protein n=1 Tax=Paludifilum halophilum TaxID=1642702 RepID=A0A235B6G6_9BACL|nr:hypothetical protein [Paludifilum halophilum]OYD07195.1 hypothetical protein CHM34_12485 [Paludifilum halophilum]